MQTSTISSIQTITGSSTTVLELIADTETPVTAFEKLSRSESTGFLFESAQLPGKSSRYSIMGVDPIETVCFDQGQCKIIRRNGTGSTELAVSEELDFLRRRLQSLSKRINVHSVPSFLPFIGGLVGYLGYHMSGHLYGVKQQAAKAAQVPDLLMGLYDSAVVFDHLHRKIYVISHRSENQARELCNRLRGPSRLPRLKGPLELSGTASAGAANPEDVYRLYSGTESSVLPAEFVEGVRLCQEKICAGEAFQIVLSQRFSRKTSADPLSIYHVLQSLNPSPYGYFLKFPAFSYLGASPETLVACRNRRLTLAALAGTRRRGRSAEEDLALELELKSCRKELAEHMMLVDLGRNDLGRVARAGTVAVKDIASVVRYEHVMHLSTEIVAELADGFDAFDAVCSCFPAGTVSGAPKLRAMQILSELEPEQRGIYAGMVGYFDNLGNCDGAIAIRSALVKDGTAHVNAGAGIVFDSQPEMEYEETRTKALSVLAAVDLAERLGEKEPCL